MNYASCYLFGSLCHGWTYTSKILSIRLGFRFRFKFRFRFRFKFKFRFRKIKDEVKVEVKVEVRVKVESRTLLYDFKDNLIRIWR